MKTPVGLRWPFPPATGVRPVRMPPDEGTALHWCWRLLQGGGYRLLTRCGELECGKWTVNASDKPEKRFCSPRCRVRVANRWRGLKRAAARAAKPAPLSAVMGGGH